MKLKGIFQAVKIGLAVSKSLVTGKVATVLETAGDALLIADAVGKTIKKARKKEGKK